MAVARESGSIQTFTGRTFWPLDPKFEDIDIADIAHALSHLCRFGGHCRKFYSVADHSVRISLIVAPEFRKWALMHDASEAYLIDLPRPIKRSRGLGDLYRKAEDKVTAAIAQQFNLPPEMPATVKHADQIMLITEQRDLMGRTPDREKDGVDPLQAVIEPLSAEMAKTFFLNQFHILFGDCNDVH
jgi:hypothetical protein